MPRPCRQPALPRQPAAAPALLPGGINPRRERIIGDSRGCRGLPVPSALRAPRHHAVVVQQRCCWQQGAPGRAGLPSMGPGEPCCALCAAHPHPNKVGGVMGGYFGEMLGFFLRFGAGWEELRCAHGSSWHLCSPQLPHPPSEPSAGSWVPLHKRCRPSYLCPKHVRAACRGFPCLRATPGHPPGVPLPALRPAACTRGLWRGCPHPGLHPRGEVVMETPSQRYHGSLQQLPP